MSLDIRGASLAVEPPAEGFADRGFDHARAFQNRVAEWAHDGGEPVAVLRAPTGAGKTATFHELIDASALTLLVYPTNALLAQQKRRLEDEGVPARELSGETLEGHGHRRTEHLLDFVNTYGSDHRVVVTNPDILQAAVQNMYAGPQAMEFFDRFDAIVYDEFHFYDALAGSGLLLQTRIIADRQPDPRILFASATPNRTVASYLKSNFDFEVRDISATYDPDGDPFRRPVTLHRREADTILEDREAVADRLREAIEGVPRGEVAAAVVFNSVKDSNDFHSYLAEEHPALFERTAKDNGFDTADPEADLAEETFSILNTTSKGEVGLDYDIRTLIMEKPGGSTPAADFLQRFGRAGRRSEATVDVYGLGEVPGWDEQMGFEAFVESIYEAIGSEAADPDDAALDTLADLVACRAAYALYDRESGSRRRLNPELREDFATVDGYGKWRHLIEEVDGALDRVGSLGAPIQENDREAKLLELTRHCLEGLRSLRGRSLSADVRYPRGDRTALTNYTLLSTLRYYDIGGVEDEVLELEDVRDGRPMQTTARLPGYDSRPRDFSRADVERQLQRWVHNEIDRGEFDDKTDLAPEMLHLFFRRIRITQCAVPTNVRCGRYEFDVDLDTIPSIDDITHHGR
jgi:CRISPR-associated endonuclease/helicase Cas3